MKKYTFFWVVFMILLFQVGLLAAAQGDVVGRLTQVEGRVDILRGGQLPATPVKVEDGVQAGDVLRTKSLSKAQITFIDNSTLTISPDSRIGIEAYMFDSAQKKRNAVIQLFKGLAHVVVSKIFQAAEPDFVVKTQTAIMGVRGTDFGIRLHPNSSEILNFEGRLQVGSVFPEVSQLSRRASKVAYSFGSGAGGGGWVFLNQMQGTTVARGLPPTLPYGLSSQDRDLFMQQLSTTAPASAQSYQDQALAKSGTGTGPLSATGPISSTVQGDQTTLALLTTVTVPPTVVSAAPLAPTQPQHTITPPAGVAIPVFNILVAWGTGASDLDLHLTGPQGDSVFHVYYGSPGSLTTQPYALLNTDDLGTSGSEVITVQQFNQGGLYQASVFNYGNQSTTSTNLSTASGVSLSVINGGTVVDTSGGGSTVQGGTLVTSLTPTPDLVGNTWLAVSIDPATGEVTPVNQIVNTPDGVAATASETADPTPEALGTAPAAAAAAPETTPVATPAALSTAPAATTVATPAAAIAAPEATPVAATTVVSTALAAPTVAAPAVVSSAPTVAVPAALSTAPAVVSTTPVATLAAPAVITTPPVPTQIAAVAVPAVVSTVPLGTGASTRHGHRRHHGHRHH